MSTSTVQQPGAGIRARLLNHGAYRWYIGTIFGLAYQAYEFVFAWTSGWSVGRELITTGLLAVVYLAYIVIPPLVWPERVRTRIIAIGIYWAATLVLVPYLGVYTIWVWILVIAMAPFCWIPAPASIVITILVALAQTGVASTVQFGNGTIFAPFVTLTVAISLVGITTQITANQKLRDSQATIGALAAAEERARLARDLHDVLGHSLTVVAVKSELAGRLVERDPAKAMNEIKDIETLARTALADLRAAVSSYRDMNLASELVAARTALDAADIRSHLPTDVGDVAPELQSLSGWALREGVTNVIRHSNARQCWVELTPSSLCVRDDGTGEPGDGNGNGLSGLRERALEAGASVTATNARTGGFVLTVARAR